MPLFLTFFRHSSADCSIDGVSIVASFISLSLALVALTVATQIVCIGIAYTFRGKAWVSGLLRC